MRFLICFVAMLGFGATSSVGYALVDCSKGSCYGKKLAGPYTWKAGDTCTNIVQAGKLNFANVAQVDAINKPLSTFTCARARQGQLICYPAVKGNGRC